MEAPAEIGANKGAAGEVFVGSVGDPIAPILARF